MFDARLRATPTSVVALNGGRPWRETLYTLVAGTALGISESTVKGCVKAIIKKIAAHNRTQAATWVLTEGLLLEKPDALPPVPRTP